MNVLLYKVVQLKDIVEGLKSCGVKFKISELMEGLDNEGVIYQGTKCYNLRKRKAPRVQLPEKVLKRTQKSKSAATVVKNTASKGKKSEETVAVISADIDVDWDCAACTFINPSNVTKCEMCETYKDGIRPDAQCGSNNENNYEELTYKELMELENSQAVPNKVPFECTICITECNPGDGIVLRDCLHSFCRQCLAHTVEFSEDIEVKCPFISDDYTCSSTLQEREIKHIVTPEVYERHLAKGLAITENKIQNSFHCKTADCLGWCIIEDEGAPENVNIFNCPVCYSQNCVPCQAIHPGQDCKEYQEYLIIQAETDPKAKKTLQYLKKLKDEKRAMNCPTCNVIVIKADGCDWLQCSMCKTDICWATLGPRWGPLGRGDTSGGCRCNFNLGKLCHPNCRNCH